MINRTGFTCIVTLILACAFIQSCAKNHERALEKAVVDYKGGSTEAAESIALELIQSTAIYLSDSAILNTGKGPVYSRRKNKIDILYPDKVTIRVPEKDDLEYIASDRNHAAWSNGKSLVLHDLGSGSRKTIYTADPESLIRGVFLYNNIVIYFMNYRIYSYDIRSGQHKLLINDTFEPGYKKYYSVYFQGHKEKVAVCVGIAGSYYISIINPMNSSIIIKKIKASSSRFHLDDDGIYYITGMSGSWRLTRYSLQDKNKDSIRSFSEITDIAVARGGCLFENALGLNACSYSGTDLRIPFEYTIAGKSGDRLLVRFEESLYAVDPDKFFRSVGELEKRIPELFTP